MQKNSIVLVGAVIALSGCAQQDQKADNLREATESAAGEAERNADEN